MNLLGAIAVACSVLAFAFTYGWLIGKGANVRLGLLLGFSFLAIPSVLFAVYYLHILPEWAWFYDLRSWCGTEFLVVPLGCATAAAASLLPRMLLGGPLFALLALGSLPYLKPLLAPLREEDLQERWQGDVCLQSTPATCGPASVATIFRKLGVQASERATARAAYTYQGGTEAWYLARCVRSRGFNPRFEFRGTFTPSVGLPAMVGVRLGGAGHFIAVLEINDSQVTFADPLSGEGHMPLAHFTRFYHFTGFHMVIARDSMR